MNYLKYIYLLHKPLQFIQLIHFHRHQLWQIWYDSIANCSVVSWLQFHAFTEINSSVNSVWLLILWINSSNWTVSVVFTLNPLPSILINLLMWLLRFPILLTDHHVERRNRWKQIYFSKHISSADTSKHDLTYQPSENGFPFVANKWEIRKLTSVTDSLHFLFLIIIGVFMKYSDFNFPISFVVLIVWNIKARTYFGNADVYCTLSACLPYHFNNKHYNLSFNAMKIIHTPLCKNDNQSALFSFCFASTVTNLKRVIN